MSSRRRSASPLRYLPPEGKRALVVLGALSGLKALALILIAEAIARGVVSVIDGTGAWQRAIWLGVLGGGLRALASWLTDIVANRTAGVAKAGLRHRLAERMVARGGRDLDAKTGETTTLATSGLEALDGWYATVLPNMVNVAVIPVLIWVRILWADWVSALVIALTIPLIPVFMVLIGYQTRDRVAESADALGRLSNQLLELARGLPVLVGLGRADAQIDQLREISNRFRRRTIETLKVAFLSSLALELIATISVAVVAVFIGLRLVNGDMALLTGLLVLILAPECYLPFREAGAAFHASEDGIEAMERAERIIAAPPSVLPSEAEGPLVPTPEIVVSNLTVRYRDRATPAVDALSFIVKPGEIVALSGPSGAGKSTALAAIAGLLGTTSDGSVMVTGQIVGITPESIAWVRQHPETFAETVEAEIVLYGNDITDRAAVLDLLKRVDAGHLIDRHPAELSPGELRRVALARALARIDAGATLLLLDEPTAHLDAQTSAAILRVIEELRGRVSMIVVAHDPAVRALADRVVLVSGVDAEISNPAASVPKSTPPRSQSSQGSGPKTQDPPSATWRDLIRIVDPWRPGFIGAVAWGTMAALAAVALTSVSGWLIVRASQQPPILTLLVAIVGVRFFGIARAGFRYLERLRMHDAVFASMTELRVETWSALAAQGPSIGRFLRGERAIDLLVGDIDRVRDLTPRVVLPPVVGGVTALIVTLTMGWLLPAAMLPMIVCAVVCLSIAPLLALKSSQSAAERQVLLRSRIMRSVAALFAAAPDLRVNGVAQRVINQLDALDCASAAASRKSARSLGLGNALVIFSCVATAMSMLWLAHGALNNGRISPQVAAVLVLTPLALIDPFIATCDAAQQWPALRTVMGRFTAFPLFSSSRTEPRDLSLEEARCMDEAAAPGDGRGPSTPLRSGRDDGGVVPISQRDLCSPIHNMAIENLTARWPGTDRDVFSNLTAATAPNHWLVVTGPSGSGKSTLLSVLQAFLRPSAGRYLLNKQDTATMTEATIRSRIAWCPQEAHLFDSSLKANLLLARSRDDAPSDDQLIAALEHVGLGELLADLPDGLETRLGSRGSHLSGGQRQRVAIARTLLTDADVLLLDEPAAHLDHESADALLRDLRSGLREKIVVLVTHHADDLAPTDVHLSLDH